MIAAIFFRLSIVLKLTIIVDEKNDRILYPKRLITGIEYKLGLDLS